MDSCGLFLHLRPNLLSYVLYFNTAIAIVMLLLHSSETLVVINAIDRPQRTNIGHVSDARPYLRIAVLPSELRSDYAPRVTAERVPNQVSQKFTVPSENRQRHPSPSFSPDAQWHSFGPQLRAHGSFTTSAAPCAHVSATHDNPSPLEHSLPPHTSASRPYQFHTRPHVHHLRANAPPHPQISK